MTESKLEAIREDLQLLRRRLARGEIDGPTFDGLRERLLADLTPEERSTLATGAPTPPPTTPVPGTPTPGTPPALGPSGGIARGLRTVIPSLADLDLGPGTVLLSQWRLVRELGRGGFGAVFEAEDLHLHERQAIKVLDPAMVAKEELLARFRREVSLMRKLEHPRIVRVFDYREDPRELIALISMQLVAGGSVKQLLATARARKTAIPIDLALEILSQTLEALAEAHSKGVIHRDVTPGNVLLAGGTPAELLFQQGRDPQVKLVDFGIAGLVERSELSQKSQVLGTAAYVAPEVLDPAVELTPAADVYGAGAVAYELLTGELPLGRFEAARDLRPDLLPAFDRFALALLEKRPERRLAAKAAALELWRLREEAAAARAETERRAGAARAASVGELPAKYGAPRPVSTRARFWFSAAAALVVGALALGWGISSQRTAEERLRVEQVRLEKEKQEAVEAEKQRAAAALAGERLRQAGLIQAEREDAAKSERERAAREQEQARRAEEGRLLQERKTAEAAALRQREADATAQKRRDEEAAAQKRRDEEAAARLQRGEDVTSRAQPPGTWRDDGTGLLWTARDNGKSTDWFNAKSYCENLTLGGYSDWRLPSIDELELLYDRSSRKKLRSRSGVELTECCPWSGDLTPRDASQAWYLNFLSGNRSNGACYVAGAGRALCVRRLGG